jgi:hypothetical protein
MSRIATLADAKNLRPRKARKKERKKEERVKPQEIS